VASQANWNKHINIAIFHKTLCVLLEAYFFGLFLLLFPTWSLDFIPLTCIVFLKYDQAFDPAFSLEWIVILLCFHKPDFLSFRSQWGFCWWESLLKQFFHRPLSPCYSLFYCLALLFYSAYQYLNFLHDIFTVYIPTPSEYES
jgi:hypothetical protein